MRKYKNSYEHRLYQLLKLNVVHLILPYMKEYGEDLDRYKRLKVEFLSIKIKKLNFIK